MALILADVGGTNVRFACARDGQIQPGLTRRYQNDDYGSFDDVLAAYLQHAQVHKLEALAIAVAGPVTAQTARLTNRGWSFDAGTLATRHGVQRVGLLNDLSALGYALDSLGPDGTEVVVDAPMAEDDQRLVIGAGTGFNVSPVLRVAGQTVCLRAEAGLGSLPTRVAEHLHAYVGPTAPWVRCAEDAVRGPGLAELHAAATGGEKMDARAVIDAANQGDVQATASVETYARMLGAFIQDLRLLYMPSGGIFLAGSVVRGLLTTSARALFEEVVSAPPTVKSTLPPVAVSVITQDEAALLGCLAYAKTHT
ncbi:glucokinase [Roseobacter cerasinus]|uniref:Glucokinase n=1 Tax=Roseobacter cerasinus TaxID=2602289 RepID=A0A640VQ71_9RHOB|nr:ROK family protein [Roseobacter cerasinus]GFE49822.1 glucokinase [Roseobacter cerasinus]